jgi:tRNA-binding protein
MEPRPDASKPDRKVNIDAATFFDLDLRIGRVVDVDDFPEARKPAWKLTVDFGQSVGQLRTSAQIKTYSKEELLDRLVVGAINLGPKRIAGFTSEFLVLGGIDDGGIVRLLNVDEGAEPGDPVA